MKPSRRTFLKRAVSRYGGPRGAGRALTPSAAAAGPRARDEIMLRGVTLVT